MKGYFDSNATACFNCQIHTFDLSHSRKPEDKSIIIISSVLTALIQDQLESLLKGNPSVGYLDSESSQDTKIHLNEPLRH